MSTPQVTTGYEPSGSNWQLIQDHIFQQLPQDTAVKAGYQDFKLLVVNGVSLIGNYVTMQDLYNQLTAKGFVIVYMGGWNNPPGFIVGEDDYRITWLRKI